MRNTTQVEKFWENSGIHENPMFPPLSRTIEYLPTLCNNDSLRVSLVGWRNLVRVSLILVIIVSFMLFTVFPLVHVLYFEEFLIHDSHGFMILKKI